MALQWKILKYVSFLNPTTMCDIAKDNARMFCAGEYPSIPKKLDYVSKLTFNSMPWFGSEI